MAGHNIYDDETFFEGYLKLRQNPNSINNTEEKPALFSLLGDVKGKRILDLGCGYGENCTAFVQMGATAVAGIDISHKMLAVAQRENAAAGIQYLNMPMEDIGLLTGPFDIVVSSLAVHYVADLDALARAVHTLLIPQGIFLFSQEHPLTTAPMAGVKWVTGQSGQVEGYCLSHYALSGERHVRWIVEDVRKYHRTFADIVNGLINAGFRLLAMVETQPNTKEKDPENEKLWHKPSFLIVKAQKTSADDI